MEPLMKQLEPFARVIAPCLRGSGFSSYNNKITSITDFANDLKLLMNEYAKCSNFYIMGHQLGGSIAEKLALLIPNQIKGVITINSLRPDGYQQYKNIKSIEDLKQQPLKMELYQMA